MTFLHLFGSPIGILSMKEENGFITELSLQEASDPPGNFESGLQSLCSGPETELFKRTREQLGQYFAGQRKRFDLPIRYQGTPFQSRVWDALCAIPYGQTRSYQDIAASINSPKAVRAVGQANHRNPLLILVPCHRVIRKNGNLHGYACGDEVKKFLLELEGGLPQIRQFHSDSILRA